MECVMKAKTGASEGENTNRVNNNDMPTFDLGKYVIFPFLTQHIF